MLGLVKAHLAAPVPATIPRGRPQRPVAMEVDVPEYDEEPEGQQGSDDEEFVHEGLSGGREMPDKELDETGET